jgi:hypothetical protein
VEVGECEFKASLGYIASPYLKKPNNNNNNNNNELAGHGGAHL